MMLVVFLALLISPRGGIGAQERVHIVVKGDTVYSIARSYGVTPDELMRQNGITDPQRLAVGKRLAIPGGAAVPSRTGEYRAVRGDTLTGIARRYGISLQALLNANGFQAAYMLKEGDLLKIPLPAGTAPGGTGPLPPTVTPPPPTSGGEAPSVLWPVAAREVVYLTGKLPGVLLTGERSETVKSLTRGTVVSAGPYRGFGRVAIVQVAGGYLYVYGGCETLSVKEGDRVVPGTELGRLGLDAVSEKPQLFFMVYQSNAPVDPAKAPRA